MDSLEAGGAASASLRQGLGVDSTIEALRGRGADRLDPVRFRFIEALARRAAVQDGATRCILDAKLAQLLGDAERKCAEDDMGARAEASLGAGALGRASCRGPLADLLKHVASHSMPGRGESRAANDAEAAVGATADLKTLRYFKSTWDRLITHQRVTDSLAKAPKNAGPLNSQLLVHRALSLMRDVSPAYLNRFVSHVDVLLSLGQMTGAGTPDARGSAPPASERKATRRGR